MDAARNARGARGYRDVQVKTASQEDLLLLLLDGGVGFAAAGLAEMQRGSDEDRAVRSEKLVRAQRIILELAGALDASIGDELYRKLQDLYHFTFRKLFEGNTDGDPSKVEAGLRLFEKIREMWQEAVEKARSIDPGPPDPPKSASFEVTA